VYNFGEWLSNIDWLVNVCEWIESKRTRTINVKLHSYDTWNMESTLGYIILPMLKQLKEQKGGGPFVDDADVPEQLRRPDDTDTYKIDDNWFKRWDYVLDEMIFAFESLHTRWDDQFWKTLPKLDFKDYPEDEGQLIKPVRWEVEGECDWEGRRKMEERIQNGFRLFGVYYQALWT
jgi:hypothetical protein